MKNSSIEHPIVVGEFSLETNSSPDSEGDGGERRAHAGPSQAQRTWYRLLFEAQAVAYAPSESNAAAASTGGSDEPILGWYFWTWKTEWDIDTWSYRRGWRDGWIPSDVSNRSTFAFPILDNGCVDSESGWQAPERVGAASQYGIDRWRLGMAVIGTSIVVGAGCV